MKTKRRKQLIAKRKAVAHARALTGWKRAQWINTAAEKLRQAAIAFFKARLAEKNGPKRFVRGWMVEFDRLLYVGMVDLLIHPVKRRFDLVEAFEEAIREMGGTIVALREHAQREFTEGVGPIRHPLDEVDDAAFWKLARDAAVILTGRR